MGHGMTDTDHAFVVRDPSWHHLEDVVFDDYPDRKAAQEVAHPWENITEPLFRRVPFINEETGAPDVRYVQITEFVMNTRSDDGSVLGVVSDTYGQTTNNDLYDIAEAVEGTAKGHVLYETGGSLYGGKQVWLLLRLRQELVIKGDPHGATKMYYALQNSYDGSGAMRGSATQVRIVCANTSRMADLDAQATGTEFVFRHSSNIQERIDEAKQALAGWRDSIKLYKRMSEFLISEAVDDRNVLRFVEEFIPMPPAENLTSERVKNNVLEAQRVLMGILDGPTCEGIRNTSYGLVQAAVEYREHYRKARSMQTRFKRAMLDKDTLVTDAVELAMAAAKASI